MLAAAWKIAAATGMLTAEWNGFNLLHIAAARAGALVIGFLPGQGGRDIGQIIDGIGKGAIEVVYLLGADEIAGSHFGKAFVIYQGHHGDVGAHRADVILPGATYTEKSGTFVNTEGRVQMANRAAFAPGDAREDWAILRALSDVLGHRLPFDSLDGLRAKLYAEFPHFAALDTIAEVNVASSALALAGIGGAMGREAFVSSVKDFYLTNPIARASGSLATSARSCCANLLKIGP